MYRILLRPVTGATGSVLILPRTVLAAMALPAGGRYEVQAGPRLARTTIVPGERTGISTELRQRLKLPAKRLPLHVYRSGDQLRLGPFLGILAKPQKASPFGEQTSFFARLIQQAAKMHISAYVFSPKGVDAASGTILAFMPASDGSWQQVRYPFPDVVYDRGFFKHGERASAAKLRLLLQDYGVQLFNGDLGDKWQVYRHLLGEPALAPFLPETDLASPGTVVDYLKRYGTVYVKPACGNQGRHVFRVQRHGQQLAVMAHMRKGQIRHMMLPGPVALQRHLAATAEPCPYLVQQGLYLRKVRERTVDMRALVQKGRDGAWFLTGVGVRLGARASVVSNLHAGGQAARLDVLVAPGGKGKAVADLYDRVEELALHVAAALDRHSLLGELGIDLGLDTEERLWVIEVNLKPGRATFRRARLLTAWRRSSTAPLQYTIHLWEQAAELPAAKGKDDASALSDIDRT